MSSSDWAIDLGLTSAFDNNTHASASNPTPASGAVPPGYVMVPNPSTALTPYSNGMMWKQTMFETLSRLQFSLQNKILDKVRTGNSAIDLAVAAVIFDTSATLATSKSIYDYVVAKVRAVWRFFSFLVQKVGALMKLGKEPISVKSRYMRVESITPNMRKNTLYQAVQWYLESVVDVRMETGMMLYMEQELGASIDPPPMDVQHAYPTEKTNKVTYQGHKITFKFLKEMKTIYGAAQIQKENHVVVLEAEVEESRTRDLMEDFVQMCRTQYQKHLASKTWVPQIFRLNRVGARIEWKGTPWRNNRKLTTISLREGQMDHLLGIIRDFSSSEQWHLEHGIPYKLVILLYGPPGTGKTVTINALCNETKRNKHCLSASDLKSDAELHELKSTIDLSKTIIVGEDLDANLDVVIDRNIRAMREKKLAEAEGRIMEAKAKAMLKRQEEKKRRKERRQLAQQVLFKDALGMTSMFTNSDEDDDGGDSDDSDDSGDSDGGASKKRSAASGTSESKSSEPPAKDDSGLSSKSIMDLLSSDARDKVKKKCEDELADKDDTKPIGHNKERFTIAGLLAFMDGHDAHGMIAVFTTNHPELLDEAITRCGRVDFALCLDKCDMFQLRAQIEAFYEGAYNPSAEELTEMGIDPSKLVPADVEYVLRTNRRDPIAGVRALATYDPAQRIEMHQFQGQIKEAIELRKEQRAAGTGAGAPSR